MRRLLPAAALALAALAAPHADAAAATPVPAPTVHVTQTSATGKPPVKSEPKVRWSVVAPGKQAELYVDSTNLPGVTTTIDAVWTSRPVRVFANIKAVAWSTEMQRKGAPTGSSSAGGGIRFRVAGGAWSPWRETTAPLPAYVDQYVLGDAITPVRAEKVTYQFQVRFHVVIGDVNKEVHQWKVRANN
jgi:hypothetical protein